MHEGQWIGRSATYNRRGELEPLHKQHLPAGFVENDIDVNDWFTYTEVDAGRPADDDFEMKTHYLTPDFSGATMVGRRRCKLDPGLKAPPGSKL